MGGRRSLLSTVANKNIATFWFQQSISPNTTIKTSPNSVGIDDQRIHFVEQCQIHLFNFNIHNTPSGTGNIRIQLKIESSPLVDVNVNSGTGDMIQDIYLNPPFGIGIGKGARIQMVLTTTGTTPSSPPMAVAANLWGIWTRT